MRKSLEGLRKAAGLSQVQVAEKLAVDQTTVSKWENGEATPRTDKLFLLAVLYGVKVDDIYLPKVESIKKEFLSASQDFDCDRQEA